MPAYVVVIGDAKVTDPAKMDAYRKAVPATVAAHGGTYLTRGGPADIAEGDASPARVTVIRFDSVSAAKAWYDSPEYRPLRAMRMGATSSRLMFVEGLG